MIRVSLVTRTKDESHELQNLAAIIKLQSIQPTEIIVVDNKSQDDSVKVAQEIGFKVLSTESYFPGDALNKGIAETNGDFVVLVSSHCIPTNSMWIENLLEPLLQDNMIAGAYGRQLPTKESTPNDIRDLYTIFGSDYRIQTSDIFFHNANSIIRKSVWLQVPFSATATNVEDRIWAKNVLALGYRIVYTPKAIVFHGHGVNHNGKISRAVSIAKVFSERDLYEHEKNQEWFKSS